MSRPRPCTTRSVRPTFPAPACWRRLRGSVLARQAAGAAILAELLKSPEKDLFNVALRVARELKAAEATDVLLAEPTRPSPTARP